MATYRNADLDQIAAAIGVEVKQRRKARKPVRPIFNSAIY